MKMLYVLRHSKAGQTNKRILDDHERPLTKKGERLCEVVANDLGRLKAQIDVVLCSTAKRCVQTYEGVNKHRPLAASLELSSNLYLADVHELLAHIRRLDNGYHSAMLVGHNPGLHELCLQLASQASDKSRVRELKSRFSPPSLAVFEFPVKSWQDIRFDGGELTHYFRAVE